MARPAATRQALAALREAAEGVGRHLDLCLCLRRLTVDLPQEAPEGWTLRVGGVELLTTQAGQAGVPVTAIERGASTALLDGAVVEGGGTLHAETVLRAGGRWDTLLKRYDGPGVPLLFDLQESQLPAARWVAAWLARYKSRQSTRRRQRDMRTLMDYGNRGGGKTTMGLFASVAIALEVPGTIAWIISRARTQSQDEIHDALVSLLPRTWYDYRGQPLYRFTFLNGSRIREMTADAPADLKQGRVDWAFLNEGAKMPRLAYAYPIGRISDRGGLCYIASNPPTADVPCGVWVWKLFRQIGEKREAGEWFPVHAIQTDAAGNAAVDQSAREDVALILEALDPALAAADAGGTMQGATPLIIPQFNLGRHRRMPPQVGLPDITGEVLRRHPRVRRAFHYIAGVDFQASFPHITCTFFRLYGSIETPILWAISCTNPEGSEDDFLDTVLLEGVRTTEDEADEIEPGTVLWIGDSSAQWQNSKHESAAPPSFPPFLNRGLTILSPTLPVSPNAKFGRNPPVGVSLGQVKRGFQQDRILLSPLAQGLIEDCRDGEARETERGLRPDKAHSHFLDTLRYVLWFLAPPTKRKTEERRGSGVAVLPRR